MRISGNNILQVRKVKHPNLLIVCFYMKHLSRPWERNPIRPYVGTNGQIKIFKLNLMDVVSIHKTFR